jgi:hypothetical protein
MVRTTDKGGGGRLSRREALACGAGATGFVALAGLVGGCSSTDKPTAPDDELAATDAALVKYREARVVAAPVPDPAGIAVASDGSLWVAGNGTVARLIAATGPNRSDRAVLLSEARVGGAATCLTAIPGALFVGVGDHVEVIRAGRSEPEVWDKPSEAAVITCIAVGKEAVYVADAGARNIARCDFTGRVFSRLCEKDPARNYAGLIVPSPHLDVAVDDDGAVHVANPGSHRIEIYEADGSPRWSWGESSQDASGFCGCCNPTDFALMPHGGYVTAEKGIPRVKIYSRDGHFQCMVVGHEGLTSGVVGLDLAVFGDGRIAVLDPGARAVRVFEPKEALRA